jgi:hypothetical protein
MINVRQQGEEAERAVGSHCVSSSPSLGNRAGDGDAIAESMRSGVATIFKLTKATDPSRVALSGAAEPSSAEGQAKLGFREPH